MLFLTDCQSKTWNLHWPAGSLTRKTMPESTGLVHTMQFKVQWIPAHCGICRNLSTFSSLSRNSAIGNLWIFIKWAGMQNSTIEKVCIIIEWAGMPTPWQGQGADCNNHSIPSPSERQQPSQNGCSIPVPESQKDQVHRFEWQQQTTVFHLRTGHCCLLQHMCQLGLDHAEDCPCQTGSQGPEHVLWFCPLSEEVGVNDGPKGHCCRGTYGATEDCPCQTGPQNCCRGTYGATEDCPCQTEPQGPEHVLQFCPLSEEVGVSGGPKGHCCRGTYGATEDCPCQTGPQGPEHVLQFCPLFEEARAQQWPQTAMLQGHLWGSMEDLLKTTVFVQAAGLTEAQPRLSTEGVINQLTLDSFAQVMIGYCNAR